MKKKYKITIAVVAFLVTGATLSYFFNSGETTTETKTTQQQADNSLTNSQWDGSVQVVKQHLKANLHDWNSYESIEWSPVQRSSSGEWMVRNKFRAKNNMGATVINDWIFYYNDKGEITSVVQ